MSNQYDIEEEYSDQETRNRKPSRNESGRKGPSENGEDDEEIQRPGKIVLEYAVSIAIAIALALLVNSFILLNARIPSGSMESTIMTGDRIFGFRLAYLFSDPERGDIVIFKYPDDESTNFIKRIIGLPGETVEIRQGLVYINGSETPLDESAYLNEPAAPLNFGPYEVPEGCYFMLGDNRNHSKDSRYWDNTYVAKEKILAKAFFRYWGGFKIIK